MLSQTLYLHIGQVMPTSKLNALIGLGGNLAHSWGGKLKQGRERGVKNKRAIRISMPSNTSCTAPPIPGPSPSCIFGDKRSRVCAQSTRGTGVNQSPLTHANRLLGGSWGLLPNHPSPCPFPTSQHPLFPSPSSPLPP